MCRLGQKNGVSRSPYLHGYLIFKKASMQSREKGKSFHHIALEQPGTHIGGKKKHDPYLTLHIQTSAQDVSQT